MNGHAGWFVERQNRVVFIENGEREIWLGLNRCRFVRQVDLDAGAGVDDRALGHAAAIDADAAFFEEVFEPGAGDLELVGEKAVDARASFEFGDGELLFHRWFSWAR